MVVNQRFLDMLNAAELLMYPSTIPLPLNSGYRCAKHNAEVGGKPSSAHRTGEAVDIMVRSSGERHRLLKALLSAGFNRIGIGANFLHADSSLTLPQNVIWMY
jgi:uncharacterized protein YcbK (DUF882 family)